MVANASNCSLDLEPIFFGSLNIAFALPGLFLNLIFILTVLKDTNLCDNLKALILLAVGDLLISLYVLVYGATQVIVLKKVYGLTRIECFYKRPHLVLFIISSQWQSLATFIVALERMWAILFPFKYYSSDNRNKFFIVGLSSLFLLLLICFLYAFLKIAPMKWSLVPQDLCYPTTVVCKNFSAYLFFWPVVLGVLTILCYVVVAFVKVRDHWGQYTELELAKYQFDRLQRAKQTWIIKICLILTATTFIFIVMPYAILFFAIESTFLGSGTTELSTNSLILVILGGTIGGGLCLHCCWCCFLYCLIWCRDRSLSRQMRHRQQYMPKLPFVILHPEQNKSVIRHSFSSFASTTSMMSTMNKTATAFQSNA